MKQGSLPQQFDRSERVIWSEHLQRYVVDYMPFIINVRELTPEEKEAEEEQDSRRADNF